MGEVILEIMPVQDSNSRLLAEKYVSKTGNNRSVLYIVPTQRKAAEMRNLLSARVGGALLGEVVLTLDALVMRLTSASGCGIPLNAAKRRVLLEDVFNSGITGRGDFKNYARYPGIAAAVSSLIEDIKQGGANTSEELRQRAAQTNRNVKRNRLESVLQIYAAYEKRLLPGGNRTGVKFVDEADLCIEAAEYLRKGGFSEIYPDREIIIWDGFYDFNPSQRKLVDELIRSAGKSVLMIELPGGSLKNKSPNSAYSLSHETIAYVTGQFSNAQVVEHGPGSCLRHRAERNLFVSRTARDMQPVAGAKVKIIPARSRDEEVKNIAAQIMMEISEDKNFAFSDICVVFPSLQKYLPAVREIFPLYGIPYNCGAGEQLLSSPVVSSFMVMLELSENNFARDTLLQFLSSPFTGLNNLIKDARGVVFDPFDFDAVSREAGVGGGIEGIGPEEWINKFEKLAQRIRKEEQARNPDGTDDQSQQRTAMRQKKIKYYIECLKALTKKFSFFRSTDKYSLEKYFHELEELMEYFEIEKIVYERNDDLPGSRSESSGARALVKLFEVLSECRSALSLVASNNGFTTSEYSEYIRAAVQGEGFHSTAQGTGVQVAGIYETRGLSIKRLFLGGALEGELPGSTSRNFYLSSEDRKNLGIASIRSDSTEEKMIFHRLVSTVEDLYISWPQREGGTETISSSFLENLYDVADIEQVDKSVYSKYMTMRDLQIETGRALLEKGDSVAGAEFLENASNGGGSESFLSLLHGCDVTIHRKNSPQPGAYDGMISSPDLVGKLKERFCGGTHRFSASQVETYARCPFKYFCSRYVLRLDAPEEVSADVDFAEAGTIVHRILMEFYRARIGANGFALRVTPDNCDEARKQMAEIAESVLGDYDMDGIFRRRFVENIVSGLKDDDIGKIGMLKAFLNRESQLPAIVHPYMFEKEIPEKSTPDETWFAETAYGRVPFAGKVDRVDAAKLVDGTLEYMVVDYKTGKSRADINNTYDGIDFQLPVYILLLSSIMNERDKAVGATYDYLGGVDATGRSSFAIRKSRTSVNYEADVFMVVGKKKKGILEDVDFEEMIKQCEENLVKIVESLAAGYFHTTGIDETVAGCSYCDYASICRKDIKRTENWMLKCVSGEHEGSPYVPGMLLKEESDETD